MAPKHLWHLRHLRHLWHVRHVKQLRLLCVSLCLSLPGLAMAQEGIQADLKASASAQITQDTIKLTFSQHAQGQSAVQVNEALAKAINQAKASLPKVDGVTVSTGQFRTYPIYDKIDSGSYPSPNPSPSPNPNSDNANANANVKASAPIQWRGRADLILNATPVDAVSASAQALASQWALTAVQYSLSDTARQAAESRLISAASQAFKVKAEQFAKSFGYKSYQLLKLELDDSSATFAPTLLARGAMNSPGQTAQPSLQFDPDLVTVTVTVSGTVEFMR